jgi:hypothetical protein
MFMSRRLRLIVIGILAAGSCFVKWAAEPVRETTGQYGYLYPNHRN